MKRTALLILDGWGYRADTRDNAVAQASTPNLDRLKAHYPSTTIGASGMAVGLPEGQMGNSEVGHLNLGAGRIVYQDFTRINLAIETGEFYENPVILRACRAALESGGKLHLMGLLSDGGVHSHISHLFALLETAGRVGVERVYIHAFMDGRDTPPKSGLGFMEELQRFLDKTGLGRLATVGGRFWGMDRDTRWGRVEKAYLAMRRGEGSFAGSGVEAVSNAYAAAETDEFMTPTVIVDALGTPLALLEEGDSVIFFNFRSDRARQLTRALTEKGFNFFDVSERPALGCFVMFTEYDEKFDLPIAFPPQSLKNIFAEVLAAKGCKQLRIAETEKYAHVTFFFNGGVEKSYPGEERILIPSPREVATYDQKPQMSAFAVRDRLLEEIGKGVYDCIICNFANLDMVGHSGLLGATVAAVETVDACIGELSHALLKTGYAVIVTADHGNAEQMRDEETGQPMTAHTTNPVPLLLVDDEKTGAVLRPGGILADVAPTLLDLMGMDKPAEMTGRSLLDS